MNQQIWNLVAVGAAFGMAALSLAVLAGPRVRALFAELPRRFRAQPFSGLVPLVLAGVLFAYGATKPAGGSYFKDGAGDESNTWWRVTADNVLQVDAERDASAMPDFASANEQPWVAKDNGITAIEIGEALTNVGDYAFADLKLLDSVTIPSNIVSVGTNSFENVGSVDSPCSLVVPEDWTDLPGDKGYWHGGYFKVVKVEEVAVPTAVAGLIYNGNVQTGVVAQTGYTLTNNAKTDAGSYTATATLAEGYVWEGGSTAATNIEWSIAKATTNMLSGKPTQNGWTAGEKEVVADLTEVHATFGTPVAKYYTNEGCTTNFTPSPATAAGTYYVRAEVAETANYVGAVSEAVSFVVKAAVRRIDIPTAHTGLFYDGTEKIGVADGADYSVEGGKAVEVGDYTATVSLKDPIYTCWENGTTNDLQITWSIVELSVALFSFETNRVEVQEGEWIEISVNGGAAEFSSSVQLAVLYETAAAADLDLKSVKVNGEEDKTFKFPYTLTWGAGVVTNQVIRIPVKKDSDAAAETLTLALQTPMNGIIGESRCRVTIAGEFVDDKYYIRAVPNDATYGKVTGSKLVKSGTKVTLKATANKGYAFTGWFEGDELKEKAASYPIVADSNRDLVAYFEPLAADFLELEDFLPSNVVVGVAYSNTLYSAIPPYEEVRSGSLPTISVSGLPGGLKFYAKETKVKLDKNTSVLVPANTIFGTPTKASAVKNGAPTPSKVKVTVKNLGGYKIVRTYGLVVSAAGTESGGLAPVIGDDEPYATVSVALSDDAAGKVTGAGLYQAGKKVTMKATANKGYVFAAWLDENGVTNSTAASYPFTMPSNNVALVAKFALPDEIADPKGKGVGVAVVRNNDFAGNITGAGYYQQDKKVTLKATANKGYVFAGWATKDFVVTNQAASLTFTMGTEKVRAYAVFVTAGEDQGSITTAANGAELFVTEKGVACLTTNVMCGVDLRWPVAASALSLPTVKVAGLPSGLKFTAKDIMVKGSKTEVDIPANTIYGAPTAASKPGKPSAVKVTVTTSGKSKVEYQINLVVDPLPDYAVGTFDGPVFAADGMQTNGVVKLTVAKNGKISGTIQTNCVGAAAKKLTLSAASFADYDLATGDFTLAPTYKDGKVTVELPLSLAGVVIDDSVTNGVVAADDASLFAYQNVLKGTAATAFDAPKLDAYTNLVLTVQKDGVLKVAGKVPDNSGKPISASGSSQIYYDAYEAGYRAVIYLPSKAGFDGVAEIVEVPQTGE